MPLLFPEDLTSAGTHALVIGVSAYLHLADGKAPHKRGKEFDMGQLSAAARSASEFAAWLKNDYRRPGKPLRSLRVLLSPSDGERIHPEIAAHLRGDFSATIQNVKTELKAFSEACDTHADNVVIVYVAGHGVQLTKQGAIVLLHDFGDDAHLARLEGAIDMAGLHAGMSHPGAPKTQFWFVDACRQKPAIARRFETLEGALKLDVPLGRTEASPMFLAASTGERAFARRNGVTLFNEALLWAMRGGVAVGPEDDGVDNWHVSVTELIKRLPDRVKALAAAEDVDQSVDVTGDIHEAVFHEYPEIPSVDLRVELLPDEAKCISKGTLKQNAQAIIVEDFCDWPMRKQVEAGLYLLSIHVAAPFVSRDEIMQLLPPAKSAKVNVKA